MITTDQLKEALTAGFDDAEITKTEAEIDALVAAQDIAARDTAKAAIVAGYQIEELVDQDVNGYAAQSVKDRWQCIGLWNGSDPIWVHIQDGAVIQMGSGPDLAAAIAAERQRLTDVLVCQSFIDELCV